MAVISKINTKINSSSHQQTLPRWTTLTYKMSEHNELTLSQLAEWIRIRHGRDKQHIACHTEEEAHVKTGKSCGMCGLYSYHPSHTQQHPQNSLHINRHHHVSHQCYRIWAIHTVTWQLTLVSTLSESRPHLRPKHRALLLWQQEVSPFGTASPTDVDPVRSDADIGRSLVVTSAWSHVSACHPMLVLHDTCRPPKVHVASTTMKRLLLLLLLLLLWSHHRAYTAIQLRIINVILIHKYHVFVYTHHMYNQWPIQKQINPREFFVHRVAGIMAWDTGTHETLEHKRHWNTSMHRVVHETHTKVWLLSQFLFLQQINWEHPNTLQYLFSTLANMHDSHSCFTDLE